jgi:type I restriction enzyme S subunit
MDVINIGTLSSVVVPVPPLPEQTAIASFLDTETSKIDSLVSEQRRLIELLKEKRQAVISHAVTKGLDPDVPMKDSGIEWLGKVPEGWVIVPVKHGITKISQGFSPQCHSEPASEEEWGVVKVGCCNEYALNESEQKRLPPEIEPVAEYEIQNGDILMSRGNTLDLVGSAALVQNVRPRLLLCDLVYRFRAQEHEFTPTFLVHSLRSLNVRSQIECNAVGSSSTMKKVSQELVRNLLVCRPPIEEQNEIADHLAEQVETFTQLQAQAERAIELLQERRTALISAAVTGKIDVREFATEAVA